MVTEPTARPGDGSIRMPPTGRREDRTGLRTPDENRSATD